jgi:hypothetical protein
MESTESLYERTLVAAVRTLKSRMRSYIYEASGPRWEAMLLVEERFARPAEKEWAEVLHEWSKHDKAQLRPIVGQAILTAATEARSIFSEAEVAAVNRLLATYQRDFSFEEFMEEQKS